MARRVRDPAPVNSASSQGSYRADTRRVRFDAAGGGAPLPCPFVDCAARRRWPRRLLRVRVAWSAVATVLRRRPRRPGATSPCSRRTSPGAGGQRPYVATTEQIWALHDAFPTHL